MKSGLSKIQYGIFMKKINIILATALLFGFASCDDKSDLGQMQVNPQGPVMEAGGVAISYGSDLSGTTLDLNNFEGKTINVVEITKAELPDNATLSVVMQVSPDADFANHAVFPVTNGTVDADRWINYLRTVKSNSPDPIKNYIRFQLRASAQNSTAIVGGQYMGEKEIDVVSYILIEENYYLCGSYLGDNKIDQAVKMDRSARDRYEDPVFSLLVDVTAEQAAAGYTWRVVPESQLQAANFDNCFGAAEDATATDGKLVKGGQPIVITSEGSRKIQINMEYKSYNEYFTFENLYTPGPANGWGFANNMLLYNTGNYVDYQGFVYVEGEFKFTAQADWSPLNWGIPKVADPVKGQLAPDGDNVKVDQNGLYWIKTNMTLLTYDMTLINSVSLVGGFNGWGNTEDIQLTPSADYKQWTGTLELAAASEWKFRMNNNWDINLGGREGSPVYEEDLVQNGKNLNSAAGTYTVTLDLSKLPYSCTVVKK